jgi:hypothetical protein
MYWKAGGGWYRAENDRQPAGGRRNQAMIPLSEASLPKRPPMRGENIAWWLSRMWVMYSDHQEFLVSKGLILCIFSPSFPTKKSHFLIIQLVAGLKKYFSACLP